MYNFLLLVESVAPAIYLICVIGMGFGLRSLMIARGELAFAQFRLEKDNAEELGGWGISLAIIAIQFMALVWLLTNVMLPTWQEIIGVEVAEEGGEGPRFLTAIPGELGGPLVIPTGGGNSGPGIRPTQPPSPTPAGTLRPADPQEGCILDQASITIPNNGQVIFQTESIIGTANIQNFGFYRFEIRNVEEDDSFRVIAGAQGAQADYLDPVNNGPLGQIVPQNFLPGEYRFRLIVFDTSSNMRAWCEITVFISEPLPTPTPIGGGVAPGIPAPGIPAPAATPGG